jgi:hypothetical protein
LVVKAHRAEQHDGVHAHRSSIALMLAAVEPTLPATLALLVIRAALSQMDVPTRSSYVMAVVTEAERAAAASFTSVLRSLAAAASPPWPVPCSRPHSGRGRYPSAVSSRSPATCCS